MKIILYRLSMRPDERHLFEWQFNNELVKIVSELIRPCKYYVKLVSEKIDKILIGSANFQILMQTNCPAISI